MLNKVTLASSLLAAVASGQQIGTLTPEVHPPLSIEQCAAGGKCTTLQSSIVLDANWRYVHQVGSGTNCYEGNTWDTALCPDDVTCAANCALDGADYEGTYGVFASGSSLKLNFVTNSQQKNVGSRNYLMAPGSKTEYMAFKLLGQEFTFDVDVSQLPCGLNGALYFAAMPADGGTSEFPTNKAGAQYGTGYCDSQCPQDIKFINGQSNSQGWVPSSNNINTGTGMFGACCDEMDIWEANSVSNAFTPHVCSSTGITKCTGNACGNTAATRDDSICDHDGCDFNPFRMGNESFFGPGKTVDTTKPFTVVTQFITNDGTTTGTLSSINRIYVQNGVVIQNAKSDIAGVTPTGAISDTFCNQQKTAVGDTNQFEALGGLKKMGQDLANGMVLVMSLWDDYAVNMLWLDSDYPPTANPSAPGVARGTCLGTSGVPATVEAQSPGASVTYSNIKFGPIGSTFASGQTSGSAPAGGAPPPPPATGGTGVAEFGQCGGTGFTGSTTCVAPFVCTVLNPFFSQCLTA